MYFKNDLKILIGEYLSKCKNSRYEIIETFNCLQIFEGSELDKGFLTEVLELNQKVKML